MKEITTETIKITCPNLPPSVSFLENKIKEHKGQNFEILRYSIVKVEKDILTLSVSGRKV